MSRQVVLKLQPGESEADFISRLVSTAPKPAPALTDRLRALLAIDDQVTTRPAVHQDRAAA